MPIIPRTAANAPKELAALSHIAMAPPTLVLPEEPSKIFWPSDKNKSDYNLAMIAWRKNCEAAKSAFNAKKAAYEASLNTPNLDPLHKRLLQVKSPNQDTAMNLARFAGNVATVFDENVRRVLPQNTALNDDEKALAKTHAKATEAFQAIAALRNTIFANANEITTIGVSSALDFRKLKNLDIHIQGEKSINYAIQLMKALNILVAQKDNPFLDPALLSKKVGAITADSLNFIIDIFVPSKPDEKQKPGDKKPRFNPDEIPGWFASLAVANGGQLLFEKIARRLDTYYNKKFDEFAEKISNVKDKIQTCEAAIAENFQRESNLALLVKLQVELTTVTNAVNTDIAELEKTSLKKLVIETPFGTYLSPQAHLESRLGKGRGLGPSGANAEEAPKVQVVVATPAAQVQVVAAPKVVASPEPATPPPIPVATATPPPPPPPPIIIATPSPPIPQPKAAVTVLPAQPIDPKNIALIDKDFRELIQLGFAVQKNDPPRPIDTQRFDEKITAIKNRCSELGIPYSVIKEDIKSLKEYGTDFFDILKTIEQTKVLNFASLSDIAANLKEWKENFDETDVKFQPYQDEVRERVSEAAKKVLQKQLDQAVADLYDERKNKTDRVANCEEAINQCKEICTLLNITDFGNAISEAAKKVLQKQLDQAVADLYDERKNKTNRVANCEKAINQCKEICTLLNITDFGNAIQAAKDNLDFYKDLEATTVSRRIAKVDASPAANTAGIIAGFSDDPVGTLREMSRPRATHASPPKPVADPTQAAAPGTAAPTLTAAPDPKTRDVVVPSHAPKAHN